MTVVRTLDPGIYIQPYMAKVKSLASLNTELDKWKQLGISGMVSHGFVGDLDSKKFAKYTKLCKDRGVKSMAAFGLNSLDPRGKGDWIGKVAQTPGCDGIVFDMEGAWEDEKEDKKKAKEMGDVYRSFAPNMLTIDQPWPIPTVHWSMFPWEETSRWIDVRADQRYVNNWRKQWNRDAYEKFEAWHKKEWAKLEDRLRKVDPSLVKQHIPTFQGYFWIFSDAVKAVCEYPCMIVWCEPFPEKEFMFAIETKNKLASLGFIGPGAVRDFQKAAGGLAVDNDCGEKTIGKLGLTPPRGLQW